MDHVSTDTKLKLVQMIRNESEENRMRMRSREQLVNHGYTEYDSPKDGQSLFLGLRLRIGAAILLFIGFLFMDYTGMKMGNINAGNIVSWINHEIDINSIDFIRNFTYTLSDKAMEK